MTMRTCDLSLRFQKIKSREDPKWPSIAQMTSKPENADTSLFPTFKIEENKVPFFFGLDVKLMGFDHFELLKILSLGISALNHKMAIDPSFDI